MLPTIRVGMWKDREVSVVGIGRANLPLADYLLSEGARVTVHDRTPRASLSAAALSLERRGARLCLGEGYLDALSDEVIFRTPGIPSTHPALVAAQRRGALLSDEAELFMALCPAKILGITGSDGKTTTATLTHRILKEEYGGAGVSVYLGGNIGVSLFPVLPRIRPSDLVVMELSSFQLEGITPRVARACITNLTENHLDHHGDLDTYLRAKSAILSGAVPILSGDCARTRALARTLPRPLLFSSERTPSALFSEIPDAHRCFCVVDGALSSVSPDGVTRRLLPLDAVRLCGRFNLANILAACALCDGLVGGESLLSAVSTFDGVPHRMQTVRTLSGVRYINSSIDTTPTRTAATLSAMDVPPIVICGGRGKGLSYAPLASALLGMARAAVFTGEDGKAMQAALSSLDPDFPAIYRTAFSDAVNAARAIARAGDTVLLSPAATAFDAFLNYEQRGRAFTELVLGFPTPEE